jgi:hypothetical protein
MFDRVPVHEAFAGARKSNKSKWPSRAQPGRMEPICLPNIEPSFKFLPGEDILTMGSCFARNVEQALAARGFNVAGLNFAVPKSELHSGTDFGPGLLNKYTPFSMLNEVEFAFSDEPSGERFIIEVGDDLYLDEQLHTDQPVSRERALQRREEIRKFFRDALTNCRIVIVTLGLSEAWWDNLSSLYLNETPNVEVIRKHPNRFYFEVLAPEKVFAATTSLMECIARYGRSDKRLLLTVSPVPFARSFSGTDAITANCYSKSVLRVAAEICARKFDWVDYYPSYESVTITNRDHAFENDFIHVRREIVESNVGRMIEAYVE